MASDYWKKHSDKRPSKNTKDTGADTGKKPFPSKRKRKGKSKSKGKGKKGKLCEVEGDEGDWKEAEWEEFDLEESETEEDQVAMVVRSKPGEASSAVPASSSTKGVFHQ